jgi:PleD family two-component response regulator
VLTRPLHGENEDAAGFVLLPVDEAAGAPVEGEQPEEPEVVNTRRILIVDDDEEIGALLEGILSVDGHRIERAQGP